MSTNNRPQSRNHLLPCSPAPLIPRSPDPRFSPVSYLLYSVFCLLPFVPLCLGGSQSIMQNKANFKMGNINISTANTKAYGKEQRTMSTEPYSKQTQTKPISNQSPTLLGVVPTLRGTSSWTR